MSAIRANFEIGQSVVLPGKRKQCEVPISKLVTGTQVSLPVMVVHGTGDGPTVWMNAAVHGDEINGVEIIRRVLEKLDPRRLLGTVLAVPVVNVHGFVTGDRYLPDRRDLNRSFPGSPRGSLASRIARLMMTEVVGRCSVGVDLHTGSHHRSNLPQIRADLDDPATKALASVFGAPVVIHSSTRDGSLRQAATEAGATVLLYEAGEARRVDEQRIRTGADGIMRFFAAIGLVEPPAADHLRVSPSRVSRSTSWVRARQSGIAQIDVSLGDHVQRGGVIGRLHDSFGNSLGRVTAPVDGIVIGLSLDPLFNRGDAVAHLAAVEGTV